MVTVNEFAQFLLKRQPPTHPGRLALYHFVKNFFDLKRPVKKEMLTAFYEHCWQFNYWQTQRSVLDEVSQDLRDFLTENDAGFKFDDLWDFSQTQVIHCDSELFFEHCLRRDLSKYSEKDLQLQIVRLPQQRMMALLLLPGGALRVQVYSTLIQLKEGLALPLTPRVSLEYNAHMDLSGHCDQLLNPNPMELARFRVDGGWVQGLVVSGQTFNKRQILDGRMEQYPDLFYGLKILERHFIRPESDPYYHEIVALLERAVRMGSGGQQEFAPLARKALRQGKTALKDLYPEDRLLHLLCTRLESFLLKAPGAQL